MADNIVLNAGTGGDTVGADDISGVKFPRVKMIHGADGANAGDVAVANPLPVKLYNLVDQAWRCGFDRIYSANAVDPEYLSIIGAVGTGIAVSQAGGSLVVTSGTTINSELILRSVASFTGDMRLRFSMLLSQRILNNQFIVELVDVLGDALAVTVNSATSITVTFGSALFTSANVGQSITLGVFSGFAGIGGRYPIASVSGAAVTFTVAGFPGSGTGTCSAFGWNYNQTVYSGTTATAADWDCQRKGWASGATNVTTNTTASTHVVTIKSSDGESSYQDQTGLTATGLELTRRASRVRNVPGSDVVMRLQIRIKNGTTAPASTTTMTMGVVDISANSPMAVSVSDVQPMSMNSAMPVEVGNGLTVSTMPSLTIGTNAAQVAGAALLGDVGQQYRGASTGTASGAHVVSAATTNPLNIKASAGKLIGWALANTSAAWKYVKFHNTAGPPTAGAGVVRTVAIPPGGLAQFKLEGGIGFSTGIACTITNLSPDNDTTAVAVGDVVGDIYYA